MTDLTSDKHQWHRFTPIYDAALSRLERIERLVEFGVLKGDSVRWLRSCYPSARIAGIDNVLSTGVSVPRTSLKANDIAIRVGPEGGVQTDPAPFRC